MLCITTLLVIASMKNNLSGHKQINYKDWLFHTVEYYEAIKRNEDELCECKEWFLEYAVKGKKQGAERCIHILCLLLWCAEKNTATMQYSYLKCLTWIQFWDNQTNSNWGKFCETTGLNSSKVPVPWGNCSKLKETQ